MDSFLDFVGKICIGAIPKDLAVLDGKRNSNFWNLVNAFEDYSTVDRRPYKSKISEAYGIIIIPKKKILF
jgi:hypothetical protein